LIPFTRHQRELVLDRQATSVVREARRWDELRIGLRNREFAFLNGRQEIDAIGTRPASTRRYGGLEEPYWLVRA